MKKEQFEVAGMGCMNCSKTVQNTLSNLDGVSEATVDFANKTADVTYDDTVVSKVGMQTAVTDAGYQLL